MDAEIARAVAIDPLAELVGVKDARAWWHDEERTPARCRSDVEAPMTVVIHLVRPGRRITTLEAADEPVEIDWKGREWSSRAARVVKRVYDAVDAVLWAIERDPVFLPLTGIERLWEAVPAALGARSVSFILRGDIESHASSRPMISTDRPSAVASLRAVRIDGS